MIALSDKAIQQIKVLRDKQPDPDRTYLRVQVIGGGCSGMSYKLDFEATEPSEKDKVIEQDGVRVLVDKKSLLFLQGTTLEFSDGLNGKGFEFKNPNAKRTCGCGSSFSA